MSKVKNQILTEDYAIYNADCMDVVTQMQDDSIDLSIYSPPFAWVSKTKFLAHLA